MKNQVISMLVAMGFLLTGCDNSDLISEVNKNDGFFFVCRLKKNAIIRVMEEPVLPERSAVMADKMELLLDNIHTNIL